RGGCRRDTSGLRHDGYGRGRQDGGGRQGESQRSGCAGLQDRVERPRHISFSLKWCKEVEASVVLPLHASTRLSILDGVVITLVPIVSVLTQSSHGCRNCCAPSITPSRK